MTSSVKTTIYIACLKKGIESPPEGISFNEMIKYLISIGYVEAETFDFKCHFYVWFFDHFFQHAIYYDRMIQRDPPSWPWAYIEMKPAGQINQQLNVPSPMMLHAQEKYQNYLESVENERKTSLAIRLSRMAVWLTFIALFVAIIVGGVQIYYNKITYDEAKISDVVNTPSNTEYKHWQSQKESSLQTPSSVSQKTHPDSNIYKTKPQY